MADLVAAEELAKLEYLSLVSKVCTELDNHLGINDKDLGERGGPARELRGLWGSPRRARPAARQPACGVTGPTAATRGAVVALSAGRGAFDEGAFRIQKTPAVFLPKNLVVSVGKYFHRGSYERTRKGSCCYCEQRYSLSVARWTEQVAQIRSTYTAF